MPPNTFLLAPTSGWGTFTRSRELERWIDNAFDRERAKEPWHYYGFTPNAAIWDSDDIENRNYVFVTYTEGNVSEVSFVTTECPGIQFQEISALKEHLKAEFALEETIEKEP